MAGFKSRQVRPVRAPLVLEPLESRILLSGPAVTKLIPDGPAGHPFDSLEVDFDEAVQSATLTASEVSLTGPGGPIAPSAINELSSSRYQLVFTGQTSLSTYSLSVGPNVLDAAGQPMDQAYVAALFGSGVTIANSAYDDEALVIYGGTATINGTHSFQSVEILGGATVTHSSTTSTTEYRLAWTIAGGLWIDSSSKIDVSTRGYLPGRTYGDTTAGAATDGGGGSYGGLGGGSSNQVYGDYRDPDELGSGGGSGTTDIGGGLARIAAGTAEIDGLILANGYTSPGGGPGSSGGGIRLDVGTLSGSGVIAANGGAGWNGGGDGGGGRVAVYYGALDGFDLEANVTADPGGAYGTGSAGTVYLKQAGGEAVLEIDSHGIKTGNWTPLGGSADMSFDVDRLVLSGVGVVAAPEHRMPINANNVEIENGAVLTQQATTATQEYSLVITVAGNLEVQAGAAIDVSTRGYLPGMTYGDTTVGAATGWGGGSYGGLGGGSSNPVYGDYRDPDNLGSGGGSGTTAIGGGLARIAAGTAEIDGSILANGYTSPGGGPGSSGGGIRLDVGTLSGSGVIAANGGAGWNGGGDGGGGRVAIYAKTMSFPTANVTANSGGPSGQAGSVYIPVASQLAFTVEPSNGAPGQTLPPVRVAVEDQYGNVMTGDTSSVSLSLSSGTLNGTLTEQAVNGVATFSDLSGLAAGIYSLTATDGSLTAATSAPFSATTVQIPELGRWRGCTRTGHSRRMTTAAWLAASSRTVTDPP